jgi:hypothetical protein
MVCSKSFLSPSSRTSIDGVLLVSPLSHLPSPPRQARTAQAGEQTAYSEMALPISRSEVRERRSALGTPGLKRQYRHKGWMEPGVQRQVAAVKTKDDVVLLRTDAVDARLFDMDGVVTRTATMHSEAWKQVFDDFLRAWSYPGPPFDPESDYLTYVDGKPAMTEWRVFLARAVYRCRTAVRTDPPGRESVCGIGNRKDAIFESLILNRGVDVFDSTSSLSVP